MGIPFDPIKENIRLHLELERLQVQLITLAESTKAFVDSVLPAVAIIDRRLAILEQQVALLRRDPPTF